MSQPTTPRPDPARGGPYSAAEFGTCVNGHGLNAAGRCAVINDPRDVTEPDVELGPDRRVRQVPKPAVPTPEVPDVKVV